MKRIALFFIFFGFIAKFAAANPVYSINSDASAVYVAPVFTTPASSLAYSATDSAKSVRLKPLGNVENYLVVMNGGLATVNLNEASSFSFLWGSPDVLNAFSLTTSLGTYSFTGMDLYSQFGETMAKNSSTSLFTITTSLGEVLEDIKFSSGNNSFELAVPNKIPEPGTWILLLSGMGLLASQMRKHTKNTGTMGI